MRNAECRTDGKRSHERGLGPHGSAGQEAAGGMATRCCVAMWSKRSLLGHAAGSNLGVFAVAVSFQSAICNLKSAILWPFNPQFAIRNPQSRV
jgi:hypothetical protein